MLSKHKIKRNNLIFYGLIIVTSLIFSTGCVANNAYFNPAKMPTPSVVGMNNIARINENNLAKNFFRVKLDPAHDWLSVSKGAYNGQFYTRDTFVSFIGGVEADNSIRDRLAYALDWFGTLIEPDGYLPIWVSVSNQNQLNIYNFCPYNKTIKTGGIRQLDHMLEYINAVYLNYRKTKNKVWLRAHLPYIEKIYAYLQIKTDDYLLVGPYSEYAGSDWADQIRRSGKASFINAYWYQANRQLAEIYGALGEIKKQSRILEYAQNVKRAFNKLFWVVSTPHNCGDIPFGHYLAWKNDFGTYDYFEIDGNTLAIAAGLANEEQTKSILNTILARFGYFVDKNGATRVVCGHYDNAATNMAAGSSQNGAYWYIVSYYLTMALARNGNEKYLYDIYDRAAAATEQYAAEGLNEWYYENGKPGGAPNYSWSLMYPVFLISILENNNPVYKIGQPPSFDYCPAVH